MSLHVVVISAIIVNFEVQRILVDNESTVYVLSYQAFSMVKLPPRPSTTRMNTTPRVRMYHWHLIQYHRPLHHYGYGTSTSNNDEEVYCEIYAHELSGCVRGDGGFPSFLPKEIQHINDPPTRTLAQRIQRVPVQYLEVLTSNFKRLTSDLLTYDFKHLSSDL
ncbi:hypothetical protein Fot_42657 [Forsythia ovata]|uniref:Uncharacterized protein n=1 Tax=Forsythia ovata TaxID=205694 RepID=A0ABD1RLT7_9LAMI